MTRPLGWRDQEIDDWKWSGKIVMACKFDMRREKGKEIVRPRILHLCVVDTWYRCISTNQLLNVHLLSTWNVTDIVQFDLWRCHVHVPALISSWCSLSVLSSWCSLTPRLVLMFCQIWWALSVHSVLVRSLCSLRSGKLMMFSQIL